MAFQRLHEMPSVLAVPLHAWANEDSPVLKLWHACDAVELTLRMAVIVGLADLGRSGPIPAAVMDAIRPRIEEPTLGKWKLMAHAVARHLRAGTSVLPEFSTFVAERLVPFLDGDGTSPRTPHTSFIELRNRLAHGAGVTKAAARRLLGIWTPRFEAVFRDATFLPDLVLVVRHDGRLGALRGASAGAEAWECPADVTAPVHAAFARGDEVALVCGSEVLRLWPLAQFGPVADAPDDADLRASSPQV